MQMPSGIQFQRLFESVPGLYLILLPDLTIIAVSDAYLKATMTRREEILGRGLFDVFPDNPDDPAATGVSNLRASLNYVLQNGTAHTMAVQKYDIRRPDGSFEVRYWSPLNKPVFDDNNKILYIIHRVEDVTEYVALKYQQEKNLQINEELRSKVEQMEMDIYIRAHEIQNRERMIQTVFSGAPDAVIVIDQEGRVVKWNPMAEKLFGWKASEITGELLSDTIIPQRYREAHKTGLKQYLKTGEGAVIGKPIEIQAINKVQTEFDVALSISPVKINDKFHFIGFVRDITKSKEAEEEVKASNQRFTTVFNVSPVAITINDASDRTFMYVNDAFCNISGFKREEVIGKRSTDLEIVTKQDQEKRIHSITEGGNIARGIEINFRKANGEIINVINSIERIEIDNKPCWISAFIDITDQKKAEEKFRGLLESAPDATIIANSEGKIVLINRQTEILFGYNRDELIGQPVEILVPYDFLQKHAEHRTGYYKEPKFRSMGAGLELFAIRHDGSKFPVEISLSPLQTPEGLLVSAAIRDISIRKKNEALIKKQQQEVQDLINSMSTLVAKVGLDGRLLVVNKTALMATGLKMEDLLQINFLHGNWWTFDPDVHKRVCDAFEKACSGIPVNYDENIFVFEQVLTINFSLIPIFGQNNKVEYIVAEGRDITSLKQLSAALQAQTDQLEKANKELEAFSYSVSHDLRAPLRIIDGYTEIMTADYESQLDEEGKRILGIIKGNARRMGLLIDDLLNFSRLGRKELTMTNVDMNKMIQPIITETASGNNVSMHVSRLEPAQGDSNLLKQVWSNLISNAVKYSAVKPDPTIEINSWKKDHEIIYSIKDNGVGFNMKYADKLFGVFQRLHKATEFEGTGVGLALVQRIINRHGGRVWAEAEVNKGATFYFSLPDASSFQTRLKFIHQKNEMI